MKRTLFIPLIILVTACSQFRLDPVKEREVIITDPPNAFLKPWICGDESIDVSCTIKKC